MNMNKLLGGSVIAVAVAMAAGAAMADRKEGPRVPPAAHGAFGPAPFDFAAIDGDKDGKITQDELKTYRETALKGVDADGDGLVSLEELTAMRMKAIQSQIEAQSKAMIERRDVDGDGKLWVAEMLMPTMPLDYFTKMDRNQDGALTPDELSPPRPQMMPRPEAGPHGKHGWDRHEGPRKQGFHERGPKERGPRDMHQPPHPQPAPQPDAQQPAPQPPVAPPVQN